MPDPNSHHVHFSSSRGEPAENHHSPPAKLKTLLDEFVASHPYKPQDDDVQEDTGRDLHRLHHGIHEILSPTEKFLVLLASALYAYGTPTHFLARHMQDVAKGLGHEAQFVVLPTYMLVAFRKRNQPASYPLFFSTTSGLDMYKLQLVDELARRVASYASQEPPFGNVSARSRGTMDGVLDPNLTSIGRQRSGLARAMTMGALSETLERQGRGRWLRQRSGSDGRTPRSRSLQSSFARHAHDVPAPANVTTSPMTSSPIDAQSNDVEQGGEESSHPHREESDLREQILHLASFGPGFFAGPFGSLKARHSGRHKDSEGETSDSESDVSRPLLSRKNDQSASYQSTEGGVNGATKDKHTRRPSSADLADAFESIAVEDATKRLKQIVSLPDLYPEWFQFILAGVSSGCGAGLFFGGGWYDVAAAGVFGTIVGGLGGVFEGRRTLDKVYHFIGAVFVAFASRSLIHFGVPLCYSATTISSIMYLLQGLTITLALVELATRHMISGTTRLAYGLTMTGLIGYGLDLGSTLATRVLHIPKVPEEGSGTCADPVTPLWQLVLFLPTSLALSMSINAHLLQLPFMTFISAIGYAVYYLADQLVAVNLSSAIGAFAVGVASNVYARWTGIPAIVGDLGGLNMLFPGGLAVRGITKVIEGVNIAEGLGLITTVMIVGLSLGVGLFMAGVVAPLPAAEINRRRGQLNMEILHF
ncbi:uncharacterized protein SPPG_05540 [Spizellomyces punctatus DAOM BR117]|uniref:Threonine/serine exporter-like N-terminal domain-containing protein n=1 Tax=Spizellomyces punctatus (strain DAOM BR117) TaxID=645134 RepID=A0A0L0HE43_SPIPD|nr:uncharacterized protein SPPG_05540 [Spizellomyces punctatus DAOM BR117]KNC99286.1 hypothetical protein SPPG_05540 [Spizellomyces punctatus DAOM BR117]|eukprot:XP_016607326.1 hypothetical protein SPPG_05540 [Spizellomyces punctatus DAOM BR117]